MGWSRQIKQGLEAKQKLGFIKGTVKKPNDDESVEGKKWITYDYLVTSWIINSMKPQYAEVFKSAQSAGKLWTNIYERYG